MVGEGLREIVIFLAHHPGWPNGAALNTMVETAVARHERATQAGRHAVEVP